MVAWEFHQDQEQPPGIINATQAATRIDKVKEENLDGSRETLPIGPVDSGGFIRIEIIDRAGNKESCLHEQIHKGGRLSLWSPLLSAKRVLHWNCHTRVYGKHHATR